MSSSTIRNRLGAGAFGLAGLMFVLYPAVRPWEDESTAEGAVLAMASSAWVASHVFAMFGFVLVGLGMLAARGAVNGTPGERLADVAVVATWVGAGLTLPYYGAETFGLHAIATAEPQGVDLLAVVEGFRFEPVAITTFGLGLLALACGSVLAAVAFWRSGAMARHVGVPFALGFLLFLPQFFTPPAVRIGHGVLVGIGCVMVAVALWRTAATEEDPYAVPA